MWRSKAQLRQYVWDKLVATGVAAFPLPPHGRIPNFIGARRAAERIRLLPNYRDARCVFTGPDGVLKPLRDLILADGKILAYATPHMKAFKMLRPAQRKPDTTIKGLIKYGEPLKERVDIIVVGSVAVDLKGNRIGKGAGYGDREIAHLRNLNPEVLLTTLVHSSQVFEDISYLMEPQDVPVGFILTEKELIEVPPGDNEL